MGTDETGMEEKDLYQQIVDEGGFLTIQEIAKICRVHDKTVYRWIEDGLLEASELGIRTYRVRRPDLNRFLAIRRTVRKSRNAKR